MARSKSQTKPKATKGIEKAEVEAVEVKPLPKQVDLAECNRRARQAAAKRMEG